MPKSDIKNFQQALEYLNYYTFPYKFSGHLYVGAAINHGLTGILELGYALCRNKLPMPTGRIHIVGESTDETYQAFWPNEPWQESE